MLLLKKIISKPCLLLSLLLINACNSSESTLETPKSKVNFKFNYIAIGDSLTHGVQDGLPNEFNQINSYAAVIARQLSSAYQTEFRIPLLKTDESRKNPNEIPTLLGIAGEDSTSLLQTKAGDQTLNEKSTLHDKTLYPISSSPYRAQETSQLDAALWLSEQWKDLDSKIPKIITFWIGNNDVLGAVVDPGSDDYRSFTIQSHLTPPDVFRNNLEIAFQKLKTTQANIFVANIPDISQIAYLVPKNLIEFWIKQSIPDEKMKATDRMSLFAALNLLSSYRNGTSFNDLLNTYFEDKNLMSSEEAALVSNHVMQLNTVIEELCRKYGFILVEMHQALQSPKIVEGIRFTNEWGRGGFFSLDGVHFSNSGYVYAANIFLERINGFLNLSIPFLSIQQTYTNDPYRDLDQDGFPVGPSYTPEIEIMKLLFQFQDINDSNPALTFELGS